VPKDPKIGWEAHDAPAAGGIKEKQMKWPWLQTGVLAAILLVASVPSQSATLPISRGPGQSLVPWTFREDFHHGIPGWRSYPLAQDIGYDPSIYTKEIAGVPCLVRDVKAYGQHILRVGIIKPLRFHADPSSTLKVTYELEMGGRIESARIQLAGRNGTLYSFPLPDAPGGHAVEVRGESFDLPKSGADVEAVVLESNVQCPDLGSSNRLLLRQLEINAERPAELAISSPKLVRSANDGPWLDSRPIERGKPIVVRAKTSAPLKITVYDSAGDSVPIKSFPLKNTKSSETTEIIFERQGPPGLWRAVVRDGRAQTGFQFLVVGSVPPHPRVLLSLKRLRELQELSGSTPLLDAIRAKAESLRPSLAYNPEAGTNIALLPEVSVFRGLPEYFTLMEDYSNAIAFNAVEYALSGDREALEAARHALLTIARWPTWTPPWFAAHGLHTYYEVGVFSQRVAVGYDLVAGRLTPAEKSAITGAAFRNAIEPTIEEYYANNRMPTAASNWMANSVGGGIALVVAFYGDLPNWNARLGTALAELSVAYGHLLRGLFPGDGSEAEPAGYEAFAMEGMSFGLAALHALDMRPRGTEKVIQSFWWPRYAEVTPDLVLDTGDFGGQLRGLPGFAWEAEHAHDASLRAFYETAETGTLLGVSKVRHTGRELEMAPGILDLTCCSTSLAPASAPALPTSRIFPGRGSTVLRSGWKPADTVVSIRIGPWFNHGHHDQGSFQVVAFGEKLISEAGYADYYKDPSYQTYFTQAAGHNTVLVDDNPFSQSSVGGRYWKALALYPTFTGHVLSPEADYLSAELSTAYDGVLKDFQRQFVFLKPDLLIVRDRLVAAAPHRYTWLLHIPIGATAKIKQANSFITVKQASAALTAVGENSRWMIQKTPLAGDSYGDLDRIRLHQPYEFMLRSRLGTVANFLVGMRFAGNASPIVPFEPVSAGNSEGLKSRDAQNPWTVVFRTGGGPLALGDISTDGQILSSRSEGPNFTILASGARLVSRAGVILLRASRPVTVSLDGSAKLIELHVFCAHLTDLEVRANQPLVEVDVDGKEIEHQASRGYLDIKRLARGEHVVRIRD
jgi:Heparinase II/III-like protein